MEGEVRMNAVLAWYFIVVGGEVLALAIVVVVLREEDAPLVGLGVWLVGNVLGLCVLGIIAGVRYLTG